MIRLWPTRYFGKWQDGYLAIYKKVWNGIDGYNFNEL